MNDDRQIIKDMMDGMMEKFYDLEVLKNKTYLNCIGMGKHDLKDASLHRYFHVKLVNVNGMGIGQVHFLTDNGEYLLLPWCYIISMIPSGE